MKLSCKAWELHSLLNLTSSGQLPTATNTVFQHLVLEADLVKPSITYLPASACCPPDFRETIQIIYMPTDVK